MRCPYCETDDSKVIDSRSTEEGVAIRRRRECMGCNRRFTTYETVEDMPLVVVKKDGSRERFDRHKILNGLMIACEKRPVALSILEQVVMRIENEFRQAGQTEVPSVAIGENAMAKLRNIDQVAYVRFASVYRQFTDVKNFVQELEILRQ